MDKNNFSRKKLKKKKSEKLFQSLEVQVNELEILDLEPSGYYSKNIYLLKII